MKINNNKYQFSENATAQSAACDVTQVTTNTQVQCGNVSGNELTRNSSGNTQPQSSQLAEPLWTDPGVKTEISVSELISTSKKKKEKEKIEKEKKEEQAGNERWNILP